MLNLSAMDYCVLYESGYAWGDKREPPVDKSKQRLSSGSLSCDNSKCKRKFYEDFRIHSLTLLAIIIYIYSHYICYLAH